MRDSAGAAVAEEDQKRRIVAALRECRASIPKQRRLVAEVPRDSLMSLLLLLKADVVSIHLPLTPATEGIISDVELGLMKPDACLINTARSRLVDRAALAQALRDGCIRAALDAISVALPSLRRQGVVFTLSTSAD